MARTQLDPPPSRPPRPPVRDNIRLVRRLFQNPPAVLDELRADFGPAVEVGPVFSPIVVLGSPDLIHEMFSTPADHFAWRNRSNIVGVRFVVGKSSMIVSDGVDHARRRDPVQPLFARRRLNDAIPTIVHLTDRALAELRAELRADVGDGRSERDLYPFGRLLLLGITLRVMFGERFAEQTAEISRRYEGPQAFIEAPAVRQLPHPFPFTERARVRRDRQAVDDLLTAELDRRRREAADGADRQPDSAARELDVLDMLVADGSLGRGEILDQARTIIGAGYDTTAASLAWALLSAAAAPGLWDRLRAEADAVLGPVDGDTSACGPTTVSRLDLAGRTVKESLRLHPAGVIGVRMAADDLTFGRFRIRNGSLIAWSPHLAGRDDATWDRPLEFDPDRFVDLDADQEAATQRAWIPFGRGPHACLGFGLAQIELTLILARMAQSLDVEPVTATMPAARGLIVNRPVGGARLRVAARPRSDDTA